jgi:uncharacterized protein YuzE
MATVEYSPDVQILSIRLGKKKSVDSDIQGNVVLDYDKDGKLMNIDVMEVNVEDLLSVPEKIVRSKH